MKTVNLFFGMVISLTMALKGETVLEEYAAFSLGVGAHYVIPLMSTVLATPLGYASLDPQKLAEISKRHQHELERLDQQQHNFAHYFARYDDLVRLSYRLSQEVRDQHARRFTQNIVNQFPREKKKAVERIMRHFIVELGDYIKETQHTFEDSIDAALKAAFKSLIDWYTDEQFTYYARQGFTIARADDLLVPLSAQRELNNHLLKTIAHGTALYCGPLDPHCLHTTPQKTISDMAATTLRSLLVSSLGMIAIPTTLLSYTLALMALDLGTTLLSRVFFIQPTGATPVVIAAIITHMTKHYMRSTLMQRAEETIVTALTALGAPLITQDLTKQSLDWWEDFTQACIKGDIALVIELIKSESPYRTHKIAHGTLNGNGQ